MPERRDFLKAEAAAGLTTNIFPRLAFGANDKIRAGFIGMGAMGMGNLKVAMKQESLLPVAVCDVYQPHLEKAIAETKGNAKGVREFREILTGKSIDAVCISTPDH